MKWLNLFRRIHILQAVNERLLAHVACQEARIALLETDIAGYERMVKALMEIAPSTIEELS